MTRFAAPLAAGILLWTTAMTATAQDTPSTVQPEAMMPPAPAADASTAPVEVVPAPSPEAVQVQANPRGSMEPAVDRPNPETAATPVPPALPEDPGYRAGPYKGALTAPPPEAFNKTYPRCSKTRTDSCVNPSGV